ncbi:hypothetical protein H0I29_00275 [Polaribacter sp. R2A056_3_33]|uniref:DUF6638 family protein n=1 Tax=unclassified Polaribacter TaxID=196858 RepID=UPI001C4F23DE|nr:MULTISPECIES: DUF6638 family protein [unclassified Polaribacter]QXP62657.1 hypothetical protein H0I27_12310 [Polaribacter sp. HaHaR_3_91]QXP70580.1 hypothetical protein H0I29_00275 [Polaribacter sp. R2A056_3_33]
MQKLIKANLYRSESINVSGKLVERYNKCLVKLGFTKTKLTSFSIDGVGWSPEIAEEKGEPFYLNNGEANTYAIIITPRQKGLPVYNPFNSFDRELMKMVFKKHEKTINDITRDSAVCIEFDQKIDVFYEPLDILRYKDITIKFHLIDKLHKAKEEQLQLIELFNADNNFINEEIHNKLITSAKKYGDLRERNLSIEEIIFTTDSFYTKAFGGVFLLRDLVVPVLVFQNEATYKEAIQDTTYDVLMYHISHKEMIEKLISYNVLELDLEEETTKKRYKRIQKYMFSSYLKKSTHSVKDILEEGILFKSYLNKIDISSRKKIMGLELFLEKQQISKNINPKDFIDEEMYVALHKPHSSLLPNHQDLIWSLLVNIAPKDVLFLYWYDKEQFYEVFKTLEDSTQDWVIETICNNF